MGVKIQPCLWTRVGKDKKYPIKIRVTENRKSKYYPVGYSIKEHYWLEKSKEVSKSYPNHDYVNALIKEKQQEIEKKHVISQLYEIPDKLSFFKYFEKHINELEIGDKIADLRKHKVVYKHLTNFLGLSFKNDLLFKEITSEWLRELKSYLAGKGLKPNSRTGYIKKVKHLYRQAIEEKYYIPLLNPFDSYKNDTEKPKKNTLDFNELKGLLLYNPYYFALNFSDEKACMLSRIRNLFIAQFFLHGIRISDFMMMQYKNIFNRKIEYTMRKTGAEKSVYLSPFVVEKLRFFLPQELIIKYLKSRRGIFDIEQLYSLPEKNRKEILDYILHWDSKLYAEVQKEIQSFISCMFYNQMNLDHDQIKKFLVQTSSDEKYREHYMFPILTYKDVERMNNCEKEKRNMVLHKIIQSKTTLYNRSLKLINTYSFKDSDGNPIQIPITSHLPRHAFSNISIKLGLEPLILSSALEHANFHTTESYIKQFGDEKVDEEVNKIFSIISSKNVGIVDKYSNIKQSTKQNKKNHKD